tara:strand:+ start:407 stop:706 length:300 start_codon:yes stop_codon:yes gene_type:complete
MEQTFTQAATMEALSDLFAEYDHKLMEEGAEPGRILTGGPCDRETTLGHLRYMCGCGMKHASKGELRNSFCCLGFIQGGLWREGIYKLSELTKHNGSIP